MSRHYSLLEIAEALAGKVIGHSDDAIYGIAPLQTAKPGQISFLDNKKYRKYLATTQASAVILEPGEAEQCPVPAIVVDKPYVTYARAVGLFDPLEMSDDGIHPTAVVGKNCNIAANAYIGPHCVIEDGVTIGENSYISPGCVIGKGSSLGANCRLWANVTIYHGVRIGDKVVIHSGAVIGSDGFGFAETQGRWLKVPQIGGVVIERNVEIGASTTIDRGALGDTYIHEGVKLDNQIQIGHNVQIGEHTIVAGCTGISGSTKIGKYCRISGMVGFTGHFEVADGTAITGMTMVSKSITEPGIYSSGTGLETHQQWRKNAVRFRQLDEMAKRIAQLEKQVKNLTGVKEHHE